MTDNIQEKEIASSPKAVTFEKTKIILDQMENYTCLIKINNTNGTGFFCNIPYNEKKIPVLMTNHHVLYDKSNIIRDNKFLIQLKNRNDVLKFDENRIIYFNKEYDISIIEIKKEDKIDNFLELDDNLLSKDPLLYKNESIYTIQYPLDNLSVSYGIVKDIQDFDINHTCNTVEGSSGSPILNLVNNKVFGIHKDASKQFNYNIGTFLKEPINDFINIISNNINNINNNINNINNNINIHNIIKDIEEDIKEEDIKLNNHIDNTPLSYIQKILKEIPYVDNDDFRDLEINDTKKKVNKKINVMKYQK